MNSFIFVWLNVCFISTYQLSMSRKEEIYFLSTFVPQSSALPSYFYDISDTDDFDELNVIIPIYAHTPIEYERITTTSTEAPKPDEWRLRAEYRVQCLEDVKVDTKKLVTLMTSGKFDLVEDLGVKEWMLCVLNKMNIMTEEGVFRLDEALAKIPTNEKEQADALIDHCLPKQHIEPTEIAWQYVKCFSNATLDLPGNNLAAINIF